MNIGKLIFLAIAGFLFYQNQAVVVKHIQDLKDVSPLIQTYLEINSFKIRLSAYASENEGHLPTNIGEWLNQNYKSSQKPDMGSDYFGTPYQVMIDQASSREFLLSCGPDKACSTPDDIELRL